MVNTKGLDHPEQPEPGLSCSVWSAPSYWPRKNKDIGGCMENLNAVDVRRSRGNEKHSKRFWYDGLEKKNRIRSKLTGTGWPSYSSLSWGSKCTIFHHDTKELSTSKFTSCRRDFFAHCWQSSQSNNVNEMRGQRWSSSQDRVMLAVPFGNFACHSSSKAEERENDGSLYEHKRCNMKHVRKHHRTMVGCCVLLKVKNKHSSYHAVILLTPRPTSLS